MQRAPLLPEIAIDGLEPKSAYPLVAAPPLRPGGTAAKPKTFHGSVAVTAAVAKSQLVFLANETIALLAGDPTADVRVTLEIAAEFPDGAGDQRKRAVSENATSLGFDTAAWE